MAYEAIVVPFQLNPQSPYRGSNPDYLLGGQMCWPLHHTDFVRQAAVDFSLPVCRLYFSPPVFRQIYAGHPRARASRRDRTDNLLVTNQLRFRLRQRSMIGAEGIEPT